MSKKRAKIAAMLTGFPAGEWDPRYVGYFDCFNRGLFYEAHDVLEDLWLEGGKTADNYAFHKGLIQLAGAFVHLTKDRLQPAAALFKMAAANLARYPEFHDGISLTAILELAENWRISSEAGCSGNNPLRVRTSPRLASPID